MSRSIAFAPLAAPRAAHRSGLLSMLAIHRQRRQLARLDDAALRDIGLTRDEARAEASRAPWDAPAHWRG